MKSNNKVRASHLAGPIPEHSTELVWNIFQPYASLHYTKDSTVGMSARKLHYRYSYQDMISFFILDTITSDEKDLI